MNKITNKMKSIPLHHMDSEGVDVNNLSVIQMRERAKQARQKYQKDLAAIPKLNPYKLFGYLCMSLACASLNNTIVSVSMPIIQHEHNFVSQHEEIPLSILQWITDIYCIAFASFAIPASKIGDRYGQTMVNRWGCGGFIIASALCGLSKYITYENTWQYGGFYILIVARFIQGIAAAFNMATCTSLSTILVEQKDVSVSITMNSLAFAISTAIGAPIGGFLTQYVGWEYCFFINIAFGTIGLILCWIKLPLTPKFQEDKLDYLGGLMVLIGLVMLILGFTFLPPDKKMVPVGATLTICGIVSLVAFIFWELHHPFPILPKQLLTNKKLILSLVASLVNFSLMATVTFQFPFVVQTMHCISSSNAGLLMLILPVTQVLASISAQKLSKKIVSYMIKLGAAIIGAIFLILMGILVGESIWILMVVMALIAYTMSVFFTSNNMFMMQTAAADIRGVMSGCMQTFRETGFAVGVALVNLIQDIYVESNWKSKVPIDLFCKDPFFRDYRGVYYTGVLITNIVMTIWSLLGLVCGMLCGTSPYEIGRIGYPKQGEYTKIGETTTTSVKVDDRGKDESTDKEPKITTEKNEK